MYICVCMRVAITAARYDLEKHQIESNEPACLIFSQRAVPMQAAQQQVERGTQDVLCDLIGYNARRNKRWNDSIMRNCHV